jgi:hypothetical protein
MDTDFEPVDIGTATNRCTEKRRRALQSVIGCEVIVKPSDDDILITGKLTAVENGRYTITNYPAESYYHSKNLRALWAPSDRDIDAEFNVNFRR